MFWKATDRAIRLNDRSSKSNRKRPSYRERNARRGPSSRRQASGDYVLRNASRAKWALIADTYLDTRWTPLSGVNLYDFDRSLLARGGGFERNSPEVFPIMRVAFVVRGLMTRAGARYGVFA